MMLTVKRLVVAIATLVFVSKAIALTCLDCDEQTCTNINTLQCRGGTTLDPCGCCTVCAKVEGESCGGPWNIAGVCDTGLVCSPQSDLAPGRCINPKRKNVPSELPQCIQKHKYMRRKYCHQKPTVFCSKSCKRCCVSKTTCNPDWRRYLPKIRCESQRRFYGPRNLKYNDELDYDEDNADRLDDDVKG